MTGPANLIVFQSDNHARSVLGCAGHPAVRTPTLDRIAARGARFTDAYSPSPLCCPARAAIATGRFPHQTGYWDNALAYDGRMPSWMRRLRDQGHEVVSVGKLHFRSGDDDNGFSEKILPMHSVDGLGGLVMLLRWNGEEPVRHGQWELYAEQSGVGETTYQRYDHQITERAVAWMRDHAKPSGRPWVLYVSYPSAHPPFSVPRRLWDLYDPERMPLPPRWRPDERPMHPVAEQVRRIMAYRPIEDEAMLGRVVAGYCALVTHLDEQIGRVLAAAEELGLLDRTRVMYTSDHGEAAGAPTACSASARGTSPRPACRCSRWGRASPRARCRASSSRWSTCSRPSSRRPAPNSPRRTPTCPAPRSGRRSRARTTRSARCSASTTPRRREPAASCSAAARRSSSTTSECRRSSSIWRPIPARPATSRTPRPGGSRSPRWRRSCGRSATRRRWIAGRGTTSAAAIRRRGAFVYTPPPGVAAEMRPSA